MKAEVITGQADGETRVVLTQSDGQHVAMMMLYAVAITGGERRQTQERVLCERIADLINKEEEK